MALPVPLNVASLFRDYAFPSLPDLSESRFPVLSRNYASRTVRHPVQDHTSLALAVAICLGQWIGCNDIVLALAEEGHCRPIRVQWDSEDPWSRVRNITAKADAVIPFSVAADVVDSDPKKPLVAALVGDADDLNESTEHPLWIKLLPHRQVQVVVSAAIFSIPVAHTFLGQLEEALSALHLDVATGACAFLPPASPLQSTSTGDIDRVVAFEPVTTWIGRHARNKAAQPAVIYYEDLDVAEPDRLTYEELNIFSDKFAAFLLKRGIRKGDKVALCMPRTIKFHIGLVGIFKANACYVPIDPDLPPLRRGYIAQDSGAIFVIQDGDFPLSSGWETELQNFPNLTDLNDIALENPPRVSGEDVAYLLYTSGTTGDPKGCLLTHRGLQLAISAISEGSEDIADLGEISNDRFLGLASVAFDVHLAEILVAWKQGSAVVNAPRNLLLNNLAEAVETLCVTHLGCVPSLIEAAFGGLARGHAKIKYLTSGGEKITDSILDSWANLPDCRLMNFYGPSEVTIGCSSGRMAPDTRKENIGKPFHGCRAHVVGPDMAILPRCSIGELVIEGPLVGKGYHKREDLTAKSFLRWPSPDSWGYRTGDLVRMMPDDTLEILGRVDTQIKLRGVRIESEGISSILAKACSRSAGGDADVCTIVGKHRALSSQQLVSFVATKRASSAVPTSVRKSGGRPPILHLPTLVKELRNAVQRELPAYMHPSHIIAVEWLPLTNNGKTDEKYLRGLFETLDLKVLSGAVREGRKETNGDVFATLGGLVSQQTQLPVESIHKGSHLFECGLDSLSLVRLCADIRRTFGVSIGVPAIMDDPTMEAAVLLIENEMKMELQDDNDDQVGVFEEQAKAEVAESRDIEEVEAILRTLPLQLGVIFRSMENPQLYVQHFICHLNSETDLDRLRKAWAEAQKELEILRATFLFLRSSLVQVILKPEAVYSPWAEHPAGPIRGSFEQWFYNNHASALASSLNAAISSLPPYRLNLFRLEGDAYLVLSMHHSVYDGTSLPLLLNRVSRLYHRESTTSLPSMRSVLGVSVTRDEARAKRFYAEKFRDYTGCESLEPTSGEPSLVYSKTLEASYNKGKQFASSSRITLQSLLCSVFAATLRQYWRDQDDFTIGVIRSGRMLPIDHAEELILPLISVQPLRIACANKTYLQLAEMIQAGISELQHYQSIPLGDIQNWICPGRMLFDTVFSMSTVQTLDNRLYTVATPRSPPPDFALAVEILVDESEGRMTFRATYAQTLFSQERIDEFFELFQDTLLRWTSLLNEAVKLSRPPQHGLERPSTSDNVSLDHRDSTTVDCDIMKAVADVLQLRLEDFTSESSLISLGLDSLKSVTLSKRLRASGMDITPGTIMRKPSVHELRKHVLKPSSIDSSTTDLTSWKRKVQSTFSADDLVELQVATNNWAWGWAPVTTLQAGLISQTIASNGRLYLHPFIFQFQAPPVPARLLGAWRQLIQLHSIFRTSFHLLSDTGRWVQVVHDEFELPWFDIVIEASLESSVADVLSRMRLDSHSSFSTPPIRAGIFRQSDGGAFQVIAMHHALYDGYSIPLLADTLQKLYAGEEVKEPPQFVSMMPDIIEQESRNTGDWDVLFDNFKPAIFPRTKQTATQFTTVTLSPNFREVLLAARKMGVTVQSFGQAALWKVLSTILNSRDITFGHVVHGRTTLGSESVLGPLLTTIPCRIRVPRAESISNESLLKAFHEQHVQFNDKHRLSTRDIQRRLGLDKLWDVLFLYQPPTESEVSDFWHPVSMQTGGIHVQYALNVELHVVQDRFSLKVATADGVMDEQHLHDFTMKYELAMVALLSSPTDEAVMNLLPPQTEKVLSNDRRTAGTIVPEEDIVQTLVQLVAECARLSVSDVNASDSFVMQGIDSISAIQLVSKSRKRGLELNAAQVLEAGSIQRLAETMAIGRADHPMGNDLPCTGTLPSCADHPNNSDLALGRGSPGMRWMLAASQQSGGSRYHHAFCFRGRSRLQIEKARLAWLSLNDRNPILRTCQLKGNGKDIEFRIVKDFHGFWSEEQLTHVENEVEWLKEKMQSLVSSNPDPQSPTPRCYFIRLKEGDYLIWHLHHYHYDAWSLPMLVEDFSALYSDQLCETNVDVNAFTKVFQLDDRSKEVQRSYWVSRFPVAGGVFLFPAINATINSKPRRVVHTMQGHIPGDAALRHMATKRSVSPSALIIASWAMTQAEYTGNPLVVFGLWCAGRGGPTPGLERLVFPCVNVLPMAVGAGEPTLENVARSVQKDLHARNHIVEQSDLEDIDQWVHGKGRPLCNVYLNVVITKGLEGERESALLELVHIPHFAHSDSKRTEDIGESRTSRLIQDDMMIDVVISEQGTRIVVECEEWFMSREQVDNLVRSWAARLV